MAKYEDSNWAIRMWQNAHCNVKLGDPFETEYFDNVSKLEVRVTQLQKGGRFNYLWWGEFDSDSGEFAIKLGDWWRD